MHYLTPAHALGILGGGQLGKMLLQKAADFNIKAFVLDPDEQAPARNLCTGFFHGHFSDYNAVLEFGRHCSIITIEIEHVNVDALAELEKSGKRVFPQPHIIRMVQDKGAQKLFYQKHNLPTAEFYIVENADEIKTGIFPLIQKTRKAGYDGKGVKKISGADDLKSAFNEPSVIEKCIDIEKEISVIVARNESGEIKSFPVVEMEFNAEANLVEFLYAPSSVELSVEKKALEIAENLISKLEMTGLLAVEMFITKTGEVLINEIAPRPHNSGHHTIEANITSQYEQHLRAIFNLPLGNTSIIKPAGMINILGEKGFEGKAIYEGLEEVLKIPGIYIHLYGKNITRPFRKMGHITILGESITEIKEKASLARGLLKVIA